MRSRKEPDYSQSVSGGVTCDLVRYNSLIVAFDDVPELVVFNDAHVMGAVPRIIHHHVRHMQTA